MLDDPILLNDWHAVASSYDVTASVALPARLLDHDLVLWRSADGVHAWHYLWTAAIAFMLDRRFLSAAAWLLAAAGLSCLGLIHAFRITDRGIQTVIGFLAAPAFAMSYLAGAAFLVGFHYYAARPDTIAAPGDVF